MSLENYGVLGIFIGSFLSYSLLPIPTEPILIFGASVYNQYVVLLAAMLGSMLGSMLNYLIGLKGIRLLLFRKFSKKEKRAEKLFSKYGPISLVLFSWLPIVGDPLNVAAGTLKMNFWKFMFYSALGKLWYFILIIWFGIALASFF